jgi:hypothetical protein
MYAKKATIRPRIPRARRRVVEVPRFLVRCSHGNMNSGSHAPTPWKAETWRKSNWSQVCNSAEACQPHWESSSP